MKKRSTVDEVYDFIKAWPDGIARSEVVRVFVEYNLAQLNHIFSVLEFHNRIELDGKLIRAV